MKMPRRQLKLLFYTALFVFGVVVRFLEPGPSIFNGNITFISISSSALYFVRQIHEIRHLLSFIPRSNYWGAARGMYMPMLALLIAMVAFGLWVFSASYVYKAFPNSCKWISEFEYYIIDNVCFWVAVYIIIATITLVFGKVIFLYVPQYRSLLRPQKLVFIAILILFIGSFSRIFDHLFQN